MSPRSTSSNNGWRSRVQVSLVVWNVSLLNGGQKKIREIDRVLDDDPIFDPLGGFGRPLCSRSLRNWPSTASKMPESS